MGGSAVGSSVSEFPGMHLCVGSLAVPPLPFVLPHKVCVLLCVGVCVLLCVCVCVLGVCVHALCSERAGSASYEDRLPSRHQSRGRPAHAFNDVEATFGECDGAAAGCRAHSKQSWQAVIIHE